MLCLPWAGSAGAQTVDLQAGQSAPDITTALRYWPSLDPDPGAALRAWEDGAFAPELETVAYSAHYAPETWGAVRLRNTSEADGRRGDDYILTLDAPLISGARVFLIRDNGLTENLLEYSLFLPFRPAQHSVTRLRTPVVTLAPGESALLLTHLQMSPFGSFRMGLLTPTDLDAAAFSWGVLLTAFYAFALSCLVFFFGFHAAMRSWLGVFNAALFLAGLALIAYVDGLLFRFFYPQMPQVQSAVGFFILFALSGFGFLVAGAGLRQGDAARLPLARAVTAMALVSVLSFGFALWQPGPVAALLAYGLVAVMIVANVFVALHARRDQVMPAVGVVWLAGLAVAGALGVIGLIVTGWGGAWLDAPTALRLVFAFLLFAVMIVLTANVTALRKRHLAAVEARLTALESEAQRARELLEAERNYARARDLASHRQRQLATASHDLKQPLMSLRMTFDAIAAEMNPRVRDRLNDAFAYLEGLAKGYVDDTVPEDDPRRASDPGDSPDASDGPDTSHVDNGAEAYALSVPLGTVGQMFSAEATSAGISLRVVDTSVQTTAPPLVLMRLLTNLVSNAVKYTARGGVVLGVRHPHLPVIWVCDTGAGMNADEIAQFGKAYVKGGTSQGHGLGLAVCFELAQRHDIGLDVRSVPGQGTVFAVDLSRHRCAP